MDHLDHRQVIVLDTNVCLDLFVFHDPRSAPILTALQEGKVRAVTRADCRMEWQIVLTYPHLQLDQGARARVATEFDALITCLPAPIVVHTALVPICSDPDDQKFLELARDSRASTLITKDKALLKLAKRTARAGLFSIMLPEAWVLDAQKQAST
jgi:putative PIN family toxin of toxin-antitoxin system